MATLAHATYNDECWDKQTLARFLHIGDPSLDYNFPGDPPEELTFDDFIAAMDRTFERAGV